ncbi:MAG: helix-turn-helix domain-containing protein [Verrucomicrobiota bacterium]|nr:helix-turn-helix domain-containing protein [Verrucomicrobiota bacterium]
MDPFKSQSVGTASHAVIHEINQSLKPEWLRVKQAVELFGPSRSALYEWIVEGKIESTCLRKRGARRGIRLIKYDSLAAFIERSAREGGELK